MMISEGLAPTQTSTMSGQLRDALYDGALKQFFPQQEVIQVSHSGDNTAI